jgi:hypothetical protein
MSQKKIFSWIFAVNFFPFKRIALQHNLGVKSFYREGFQHVVETDRLWWIPERGKMLLHWREFYFVVNKVQKFIFWNTCLGAQNLNFQHWLSHCFKVIKVASVGYIIFRISIGYIFPINWTLITLQRIYKSHQNFWDGYKLIHTVLTFQGASSPQNLKKENNSQFNCPSVEVYERPNRGYYLWFFK